MLLSRRVVTPNSEVISAAGRKMTVRGRIVGARGTVYAEAESLCITIPHQR